MGFRRFASAGLITTAMLACAQKHTGNEIDAAPVPDACTDLTCFVVNCGAKGLPPTTVTGTVYAPNGTLPLFGVNVYVPASDPGPLPGGVQCDRCALGLPGGAIASTQTDEAGNFRLENVPAGADIPIVVQTGKWRRQFKLPAVAACQDNAADKPSTTLPKNRTEGDMPQIAITTGGADALECLIRKLGVDDTEFGTSGDARAIHLYTGNGASSYAAGFLGGSGAFAPAKPMWDSPTTLATYDIVMLSCEGDQLIDVAGGATVGVNEKPQTSLQAIHDYAGVGGRVFMSHWHNVWIGGDKRTTPLVGLDDWKTIANWSFGAAQDLTTVTATIDPSVPKGMSFATWLMNVGGSTTFGEVVINQPRFTLPTQQIPTAQSDRRVYLDPTTTQNPIPTTAGPHTSVQDLEFTTPNDVPLGQRCGKVVFSDMHVASGSTSNAANPFPGTGVVNPQNGNANGCSRDDLSAQEKALAFIFFDISSCVGVLQ